MGGERGARKNTSSTEQVERTYRPIRQPEDTNAQPLQHLRGTHQIGDAVRLRNLDPHAA